MPRGQAGKAANFLEAKKKELTSKTSSPKPQIRLTVMVIGVILERGLPFFYPFLCRNPGAGMPPPILAQPVPLAKTPLPSRGLKHSTSSSKGCCQFRLYFLLWNKEIHRSWHPPAGTSKTRHKRLAIAENYCRFRAIYMVGRRRSMSRPSG